MCNIMVKFGSIFIKKKVSLGFKIDLQGNMTKHLCNQILFLIIYLAFAYLLQLNV